MVMCDSETGRSGWLSCGVPKLKRQSLEMPVSSPDFRCLPGWPRFGAYQNRMAFISTWIVCCFRVWFIETVNVQMILSKRPIRQWKTSSIQGDCRCVTVQIIWEKQKRPKNIRKARFDLSHTAEWCMSSQISQTTFLPFYGQQNIFESVFFSWSRRRSNPIRWTNGPVAWSFICFVYQFD